MASIEWGARIRDINESSRLNPDNDVLGIRDTSQTLKVEFEASDYINNERSLRWLLKTYNLFDGELDRSEQARIDEAFVDYNSGDWFAMVGKRRINWGHAFGFNPVNVVVPPRNLLNPDQETEGRPMIWAQKSDEGWSVDAILTRDYDRDWYSTSTQWGARLTHVFDALDTALYYFDGEEPQPGSNYPRLLGASFSRDFGDGITAYGEYANVSVNSRNYYTVAGEIQNQPGPYDEWVLGVSARFGLENTVFFEVFHSDIGYTEEQRANYFSALDNSDSTGKKALIGDAVFARMAQNYLLVSYDKNYLDNYNYLVRALFSEDSSLLFGVIATYTFAGSYAGRIDWRHTQGGADSEFGNDAVKDSVMLSLIVSM